MKMRIKHTTAFLLIAAALTLLGACSGVFGGGTTLRIVLPQVPEAEGGAARYIAPGVDVAHIVVAQLDKAYSYNNFEGTVTASSGNVFYVTNLQADTYVFGVALLDNSNMMNLKLLEYKVEQGFNDIVMDMGPGLTTLIVNGTIIDNPFLPEGYTATFGTDTIDIGGLRTGGVDTIQFTPSADDGGGVPGTQIGGAADGDSLGTGGVAPYLVPADADGVEFEMNIGDDLYYFILLLN